MALEATTLIEFGTVDASDSVVVFEFDDIGNEGSTSFNPGDFIYFRVHLSDNVTIDGIQATDGTVQSQGAVNRDAVQIIDFVGREEATSQTLSYIPSGSIAQSFYGRSGAITTTQNVNKSMTVTGDINSAPCKANLSYPYKCLLYRLQTPKVDLEENESYPISIVLYLTEGSTDGCNSY